MTTMGTSHERVLDRLAALPDDASRIKFLSRRPRLLSPAFVAQLDEAVRVLVRVDLKINQIPASVGVRSIEKSMHYELMNIAGTDFLMPRKSELAATDDVGNYSLNLISLDQCREFTGQSTITYGAPAPSQGSASRDKEERREQ